MFLKRRFVFAFSLIFWIVISFAGCSVLRTTGKVTKGVAKAGWATTKVVGKVAHTTGKVALATGKATHKGVRTVVYMAKGKQIIPLERQGNSLYAKIKLNRRIQARFLIDTGASSMQISRSMAKRLKINLDKAEQTNVTLAGGYVVPAYYVKLKEVRMGRVRVKNVRAIVLLNDNMGLKDGLIGMSFLNHFDFKINPQKPELVLQQKAI